MHYVKTFTCDLVTYLKRMESAKKRFWAIQDEVHLREIRKDLMDDAHPSEL
jgi:hypothetical protein